MSDEGEKLCAICWEELSHPSVNLECGHRFHYRCLSEWAKRSTQCPMCRQEFQSENDHHREDERSGAPTAISEDYYDITQLYAQGEDLYWWQMVCHGLAFFSTSITIIRFLALIFPRTIQRIFHPQIQAGKHLQSYFSQVHKYFIHYIPTLILSCYLIFSPLVQV